MARYVLLKETGSAYGEPTLGVMAPALVYTQMSAVVDAAENALAADPAGTYIVAKLQKRFRGEVTVKQSDYEE